MNIVVILLPQNTSTWPNRYLTFTFPQFKFSCNLSCYPWVTLGEDGWETKHNSEFGIVVYTKNYEVGVPGLGIASWVLEVSISTGSTKSLNLRVHIPGQMGKERRPLKLKNPQESAENDK